MTGFSYSQLTLGRLSTRVLIFSQASEARNATEVLDQLATTLRDVAIDHVIFTTYSPDQDLDIGSGRPTIVFQTSPFVN